MKLRGALALIGFSAIIGQIVLMRELIVVFSGNEISFGLILATWLLWTAAGSGVAGRLARRVPQPEKLMARLEAALAVAFPLSILAVRASQKAFQLVPGEIPGPLPILATSLVTLSLFCLVSGWLFAVGARLYAGERNATTGEAAASVYLLEAAGSGAGGILASLVLIRYCSVFEIASLLALLNLLAAAVWGIQQKRRRRMMIGAVLALFGGLVFPFTNRWLDQTSLTWLWHDSRLLESRNSVYGNLAVTATETSRSLFENGLLQFSAPDEAGAEEAVHFALLEHPSPKTLLLIGGGVNGSLLQALHHPGIERVDYVELDPEVIRLARDYFSEEWNPAEADSRVRVHSVDGRLFLKRTKRRFDVILLNLPDPETAQLNRFYTLEFFEEAAARLAPGGIFSFQLAGAENYISEELADFLRSIHKTLVGVFRDVKMIPGNKIHFFAARSEGLLTDDPMKLVARLRARRLKTSYVREYYIPFRMMPDRMQDLATQIAPRDGTRMNLDFAPVAYYFDTALWSKQFHSTFGQWFDSLAQVEFARTAAVAGVLLASLLIFVLWRFPATRGVRASAGLSVAVMGFTMIGLEVLLLLAFQAIYGYVYYQLAIVIAGFMVGMAVGSWLELRRMVHRSEGGLDRRDLRVLAVLQFIAAASGLVLYLLFTLFARVDDPLGLFLLSQILFPVLAIACGLLGGYQFPLANRLYFTSGGKGGVGTPYALDLLGACLGSLLLSLYFIPVFGFLKTAWLMGILNLMAALAPALLSRRRAAPRM